MGTLRINAPAPVAQFRLAALAARFSQAHPGVTIELTADAARQDILREGFDAGVRFGSEVPQDMVAVRIGPPQRYAVVGAPAYFRRQPAPRAPRESGGHQCILRRFPDGAMQQWEFQRRPAKVQLPAPRIVVNDAQIAVTACVEGAGLAYLHERYVDGELAAGRLVRVLEAWSPGIGPPYLYYAPACASGGLARVHRLREGRHRWRVTRCRRSCPRGVVVGFAARLGSAPVGPWPLALARHARPGSMAVPMVRAA